jgi:SAM-dependent methyltransferase
VRFADFVRLHVPPAPARVLEVGCGKGELALELAGAGYEVVAVDPEAPEGGIFRRVRLEELADPGPFDAVVAARSLHHVADLEAALDRIASFLRPDGVLVLDEVAHDHLDEPTAEWLYGQKRALAASRGGDVAASLEAFRAAWAAEHEGLHGYGPMRPALDARFEERAFAWEPSLARDLSGVASEALERTLIEAGAIQATGYRYAGIRRPSPASGTR